LNDKKDEIRENLTDDDGSEASVEEADDEARDAIQIYLREIRKSPLLSSRQERDLAKRISQGDEEARNDMIESNLRLVV